MIIRMVAIYALLLIPLLVTTVSAEISTTINDRQSVSLTIYNSNLALVRDTRKVELPKGIHTLAFKEISSEIQSETAVLRGEGIEVVEQNYAFDLLSPTSLLRKYLGKKIKIIRKNPKTGEEKEVEATVLSITEGVVLQINGNIETEIDGRLVFPDVPENLREKPTLTMLVENSTARQADVELSYLTTGLSWKADYVVELNEAEDRVDLKGWVTLINNSGTSYSNSKIQLAAGDIHRVQPHKIAPMAASVMAEPMQERAVRGKREVSRENVFEYHFYTVERPTTILENQTKQIALLQENNAICQKELVLVSQNQSYYWTKVGEISKEVGVNAYLKLKNDKASNLGQPKPPGTVRVYTSDSSGFSQFIGEDTIKHTPENELIKIKLGRSFDVTADRVQTDFKILPGADRNQRTFESEYEITLKNAKSKPIAITIEEKVPGDWKILSESQAHKKKSSTTLAWKLKVGAKSSAKLTYRVRSIM